METIYYGLLALILFLLYKVIETNYYLTRLNLEVKNVHLQNNRERSRTLQEVKNITKLSEQVLKQLSNTERHKKDNEIDDNVAVLGQNQSEKITKVVYNSVGPHNNDNKYFNINFNLNPSLPFVDFGFEALKAGGPSQRLPGHPLKALTY